MPRSFISCTRVIPRQRGVRPAPRLWRYRLHIGRLTTWRSARATRSRVASASASSWTASEQQWPTVTGPSNPVSMHALGHVAEARGAWIAGLVHVQVHRHSALGGRLEQADEPGTKLRMRHDDAAERAVRCGDLPHDRPERRLVPEHVDAAEVHRLELDPPRPGRPQLPEDAEGDRVLGRKGVEVGADRPRAVREGGAKRELHSPAHVRGGPAGGAIGGDRQPGGVGGAVRIGGAGPDLALVEVGVQVDEGGKDHRAPHVHAFARRPGDDPSSLDGEVEGREAPRSANEAGGRSQVREREPRHVGEAHEVRRMAHLVKLPFRLQPRTSLCTEVHIAKTMERAARDLGNPLRSRISWFTRARCPRPRPARVPKLSFVRDRVLHYLGKETDNRGRCARRGNGQVERIESKITAQGQVSVPARIRRRLGLTAGSKIEWFESDGEVVVRRASRFSSRDIHEAVFEKPPEPRSVADMDEGLRSRARRKHAGG